MTHDERDLGSWGAEDLRVLARAAGMLWDGVGRRDPLDELSARQRDLLDRAADGYLLAAEADGSPAEDDEDEYGSQDGDGFIILDGGRYYPQLGRNADFTPAGMPRNGYPDPDVACYELAALMAEHGENPDSWMFGEHGPSERDIGLQVDRFLGPDGELLPLRGVRYEPDTEVRSCEGTWEVLRDYGELGVWLAVPRDRSAGERFTEHSLTDRADDLSRARSWIADCALIRGEVADLGDFQVKRIVDRLYDGAWAGFARERELLRQARAWALECTWLEDPEDIEDLDDEQVVRGIQEHYDGGWAQFVLDNPS
jgi:hypothetical protein